MYLQPEWMTSGTTHRSEKSAAGILLCPDPAVSKELEPVLRNHLHGLSLLQVGTYPNRKSLQELIEKHSPLAVFVCVDSDRETALRIIAALAEEEGQLQIVAILKQNDPDLLLSCLRHGATEFLLRPFDNEEVKNVLGRLSHLVSGATPGKSGAKLCCVMPAKGACGASTIAANLAYHCRQTGLSKVLLADLDPLTGTIGFQLKLESQYGVVDALSRVDGLDEGVWRSLVAHWHGVDVLLSPSDPMLTLRDQQDPTHLLHFARQLYEMIFVDCGGVYGAWELAIARAASTILLVTTNEVPALQATQKALAYFDSKQVEREKLHVVVNRYSPLTGLRQEAIAKALYMDITHVIPSDYEAVMKSLMEGKPISSHSEAGKALVSVSRHVLGKAPNKPAKKSPGWADLVAAIFSRATF